MLLRWNARPAPGGGLSEPEPGVEPETSSEAGGLFSRDMYLPEGPNVGSASVFKKKMDLEVLRGRGLSFCSCSPSIGSIVHVDFISSGPVYTGLAYRPLPGRIAIAYMYGIVHVRA